MPLYNISNFLQHDLETEVLGETAPRTGLLMSAILAGKDFTVPQLKSILSGIGVLPPSTGSGKNNNVLKKDLVTAVVQAVCKDLPRDEQEKIIERIAGETKKGPSAPLELIEAVSHLDAQEQGEFDQLVQGCIQELEDRQNKALSKLKKSAQSKAEAEAEDNEKQTPKKEEKNAPEGDNVPSEPFAGPAQGSFLQAVELKPAQDRAGPAQKKTREPGKKRRATPECLKNLLPDIPALYLAWMPENRMVQVDFQGAYFRKVCFSQNHCVVFKYLSPVHDFPLLTKLPQV